MTRPGPDLALLLLGGYRALVDAAVDELAARGHPDVRPVHEYAMRAIAAGAETASDLGRRLSVTKQAAARTIAGLVERGWVSTEPDPGDGRRKRLQVTPAGDAVLREGEAIFDELHRAWARRVGADELARVEATLRTLVGERRVRPDAPGWVADATT